MSCPYLHVRRSRVSQEVHIDGMSTVGVGSLQPPPSGHQKFLAIKRRGNPAPDMIHHLLAPLPQKSNCRHTTNFRLCASHQVFRRPDHCQDSKFLPAFMFRDTCA
eukprot:1354464-Amorphochlora_amoeboformis.AAC.1